MLGGVLKNVAKTALPVVGGALGSMVAPGVGTAIGSKLGSMATNLFEFEGLTGEQAEFETARHVVRLAASAAHRAATAPPHVPPRQVARAAVTQAARATIPSAIAAPRAVMRPYAGTPRPRAYAGRPRPRPGVAYVRPRARPGVSPAARFAAGAPRAYGAAGPRVGVPRHPGLRRYGYPQYQGRPRYAGSGYAPRRYGAPRRSGRRYGPGWSPYGYAPDYADYDEPMGTGALGSDAGMPFDDGVVERPGGAGPVRTGRWIRRGRKIVLLGV